jgi:D-amino-acid dehydrogenase
MSTAVIIGAGLAGLCSARALQKRGWQVTVVDSNPAAALGTSFANAGMLTPSMADPWNNPELLPYLLKNLGQESSSFLLRAGGLFSSAAWSLRFLQHSNRADYRHACEANFRLAKYSLECLQQWQQELGLEFEQRQLGTMKIFRDADQQQKSLALAEQLSSHGLDYSALDAAAAVAKEPALAAIEQELVGAIWYPQDSSGNAHLFCRSLAERITNDGGRFCYGENFRRWRWQGRKLSGFSSNSNDYDADAIVLAAGCNSPKLLQSLGLELMVRPIKGYSLTLDCTGVSSLPQQPIIDEALHGAITPFDNSLRVAGTAEIAGYNLSKTPARLQNLRQLVRQMLPAQAETLLTNEQSEWAGLRPMSADGIPYIGPVDRGGDYDRLYLNSGHGHLGWTHCAGSAELLAANMENKSGNISIDAYAAKRVLRRA